MSTTAPGLGHALDISPRRRDAVPPAGPGGAAQVLRHPGRLLAARRRSACSCWPPRSSSLAVTAVQDEPMQFGDFVGAAAFLTSFLLPVLGIMLVTTEWSQRTAMVTFALEPRRPLVIAAKALVGVLLTLATVACRHRRRLRRATCSYGLLQGERRLDLRLGRTSSAFLVTQIARDARRLRAGRAAAQHRRRDRGLLRLQVGAAGPVRARRRADGLVRRRCARGSTSSRRRTALYDWSLDGEDWAQLVVSGFVWLGSRSAFGIRRVLRAEVK